MPAARRLAASSANRRPARLSCLPTSRASRNCARTGGGRRTRTAIECRTDQSDSGDRDGAADCLRRAKPASRLFKGERGAPLVASAMFDIAHGSPCFAGAPARWRTVLGGGGDPLQAVRQPAVEAARRPDRISEHRERGAGEDAPEAAGAAGQAAQERVAQATATAASATTAAAALPEGVAAVAAVAAVATAARAPARAVGTAAAAEATAATAPASAPPASSERRASQGRARPGSDWPAKEAWLGGKGGNPASKHSRTTFGQISSNPESGPDQANNLYFTWARQARERLRGRRTNTLRRRTGDWWSRFDLALGS